MKEVGFEKSIASNETFLRRIFGKSESLFIVDTCQYEDYSKIDQELFDPEKKAASRRERFPQDCQRAFELGSRLANGA